jgi:hypothetical protein
MTRSSFLIAFQLVRFRIMVALSIGLLEQDLLHILDLLDNILIFLTVIPLQRTIYEIVYYFLAPYKILL